IDDRDRRFDRVVGGASLDSLGDDGAGLLGGLLARLGLEALDQRRGLAPGLGFHLTDERLFRLVLREPADALEIAPLPRDEGLALSGAGTDGLLARDDCVLAASHSPITLLVR